MRESIERLMRLQLADRELMELRNSLAKVAERVERLRSESETGGSELETLAAEHREAEIEQRRIERELAEGEARIRTKRMRLSMVNTEKELQALGHEVEALKENNQRLEAQILAGMESLEQRGQRVKELEETVGSVRQELLEAQKEIAAEVTELEGKIAKLSADRDVIAASLDPQLRQRYDVIFDRRGGQAVAVVRDGTCFGCRMRIPPQLYNEILRSDKIHFCPNCQRILYLEPQQESE